MNRAMIESLYLSSTTISQDELRALLDKVEEYGMTNMFYRVINAPQAERDAYLQTTVRENIKRREIRQNQAEQKIISRGKNEIDDHIKNEMLAHAIAVKDASNIPITSEKNYEVACMLKAFAIEYMLKIINIMANTDAAGVKQFASSSANKQQLISDSMKDVRNKLQAASRVLDPTSTRRFTGHEINSLLNTIIPEQIRTLIKYKAITNYADPATRDSGEFITPTISASSMNNFVADYFLLIKDFPQNNSTSTTGMQDNAAAHNANYQSNNKAFETYRYRDKNAGLYDYNMLNCLMSSTYMTLSFLLENRDLATNLQTNQVVPYEAVAARLTQEEYDNLINLCDNGAYDKNSLIYYHSFLKQYLDTRTPKLTDERYRRINTLFNEIKSAGDISRTGETFAEWFKNIKLETLTNEELKELKVIAPEFIYNSLTYSDKLIFKKCQEANIEFEYYYKMEPEKFDTIIKLYGPSLQGQSIDLKLLRKSPEELSKLVQTLGQYNLNLGTIPNYYYDYLPSVISYAHNSKNRVTLDTTTQDIPVCVTPEELEKARLELIVADTIKQEGININPSTEDGQQTILRVAESIVLLETLKTQKDEDTKSKFLDLDTQIKSGTINYENCSTHGFNAKDYHKTTMMQDLEKKYRTDTIEPFINMSVRELVDKAYNVDWYVTPEDFKVTYAEPSSEISGVFRSDSVAGMVLGNNPRVIEMMNNGVEVKANMLFLRAKEVSKSYAYVQQENPSLEIGDYLLYKSPSQVKEIIDTCHKRGVNFRPEFLYFDTDMVKNNIYLVDWALIGSSAVEGSEFTYETAQKISNQIKTTIAQRQQSQISYPPAIPTTSHPIETTTSQHQENIENNPNQIIIISPEFINAVTERRGRTH